MGLNDLDLLALVVDRLEAAGAGVLVFGGWAEELLRLAPPRPHADIDLLLPAASLAPVDRFLAAAATLRRRSAPRALPTSGLSG